MRRLRGRRLIRWKKSRNAMVKKVLSPHFIEGGISDGDSVIILTTVPLQNLNSATVNLTELLFQSAATQYFSRESYKTWIDGFYLKFSFSNLIRSDGATQLAFPSAFRVRIIVYDLPDYKRYVGAAGTQGQHTPILANVISSSNGSLPIPIDEFFEGHQDTDYIRFTDAKINKPVVKIRYDKVLTIAPRYGSFLNNHIPSPTVEVVDRRWFARIPYKKIFEQQQDWTIFSGTDTKMNTSLVGRTFNRYCSVFADFIDENLAQNIDIGRFQLEWQIPFRTLP